MLLLYLVPARIAIGYSQSKSESLSYTTSTAAFVVLENSTLISFAHALRSKDTTT